MPRNLAFKTLSTSGNSPHNAPNNFPWLVVTKRIWNQIWLSNRWCVPPLPKGGPVVLAFQMFVWFWGARTRPEWLDVLIYSRCKNHWAIIPQQLTQKQTVGGTLNDYCITYQCINANKQAWIIPSTYLTIPIPFSKLKYIQVLMLMLTLDP